MKSKDIRINGNIIYFRATKNNIEFNDKLCLTFGSLTFTDGLDKNIASTVAYAILEACEGDLLDEASSEKVGR